LVESAWREDIKSAEYDFHFRTESNMVHSSVLFREADGHHGAAIGEIPIAARIDPSVLRIAKYSRYVGLRHSETNWNCPFEWLYFKTHNPAFLSMLVYWSVYFWDHSRVATSMYHHLSYGIVVQPSVTAIF
jgi:hypothetical protein